MTEIKRPASVRELLDPLPRATLIYLCERRGLPVSRANDDCRSSIARSFRGRRDELLGLLRVPELVFLLRCPIRDRDSVYDLPNAHMYSKVDLLTLAVRAFGYAGDLGAPFVARGFAQQAQATPTSTSTQAPVAPEPAAPASLNEVPDAAPVSGAGSSGWSRLQPLSSLYAKLGSAPPADFGQEAFGALIEAIELRGFEVAAADGSTITPLHDALPLDFEVRIRHDAFAGPSSLRLGAGQGAAQSGPVVELSDYARASIRLELLTCPFEANPPAADELSAAIDVATAGLAIRPEERVLLARVARSLARTPRDPFATLTSFVGRLDAEDGEVLLRELASLRPSANDEHRLLVDHWSALNASTPRGDEG